MKDRLFIRLNNDEQSLTWGLLSYDSSAPEFLDRGDLLLADAVALAEKAQQYETVLMLPASRVRCFNVNAPTKNRKQLEKAVPYILEEQILDNVDDQLFALGAITSDGQVAVNVIDKNYLAGILEELKQAEIEPDYVVSDASSLPLFEDAWTLLELEDSVLVKQGANEYWATDVALLADLIGLNVKAQFEEAQTVSQAVRVYSEQEQSELLAGVSGLAIQRMSVDDAFLWLCSQFSGSGINLLQQQFASQKKSKVSLGVWKVPAVAASVLLAVLLLYFISNLLVMNQKRAQLEQQLLSDIQRVFPNANDVNTGLIQLSNRFATLGGDAAANNSFMMLLDKAMTAINPEQISISQLEYIASQAQLSFDVEAADYSVLTRAQNQLEASGVQVEMRNASENGGVWSARISVGVKP